MNNKVISNECAEFVNILPFNHLTEKNYPITEDEDLVFIDQEPANEFNLNEAGWIRNDISAFEYAENEQIASQILSRFEEVKLDDIYKGLSEKEMFDACLPRRATTDPVLYSKYLVKLSEIQYNHMKMEKDKLEKEAKEKEAKEKKAEKEFSNKQLDEAKNEKPVTEAVKTPSVASSES